MINDKLMDTKILKGDLIFMIEHIVLLKFTKQTTNEQKIEAVKRLNEMKSNVPGIIDLQAGLNFSERSQGFEIGVTARLENKEALKTYDIHPNHKEVKSFLKGIGHMESIAVDFEIE